MNNSIGITDTTKIKHILDIFMNAPLADSVETALQEIGSGFLDYYNKDIYNLIDQASKNESIFLIIPLVTIRDLLRLVYDDISLGTGVNFLDKLDNLIYYFSILVYKLSEQSSICDEDGNCIYDVNIYALNLCIKQLCPTLYSSEEDVFTKKVESSLEIALLDSNYNYEKICMNICRFLDIQASKSRDTCFGAYLEDCARSLFEEWKVYEDFNDFSERMIARRISTYLTVLLPLMSVAS